LKTNYTYINQNPHLRMYCKHRKYRKRNKEISSKHGIPYRVSIKERPEKANAREEFSHLEIDYVIGSGSLVWVLSGREPNTNRPPMGRAYRFHKTKINKNFVSLQLATLAENH
jgi:IS30 family transposase